MKNLKKNPNFVIGTPGRLKDLSKRGLIDYSEFNYVVVDEIDRMLDMGFVDAIKEMLDQLPEKWQSLFFSATMPPKIQQITEQFLNHPVTVAVKSGETAANVNQDVVKIKDQADKFNQLTYLLKGPELTKTLIFIETKHEVEKLKEDLVQYGFKAESIHGDKKQKSKTKGTRCI
jgi:superfamily II DNA/RNA helicase